MSTTGKMKKRRFEHWEAVAVLLALFDYISIIASYGLALLLRFDFRYSLIPEEYLHGYFHTILIYAIICVVVYMFLKLYRSIWRFASYFELLRVGIACSITIIAYVLITSIFIIIMPASYYIVGGGFQIGFAIGVRFSYRFVLLLRKRNANRKEEARRNIMLIGAGEAGQQILRDIIHTDETKDKVCCFIDDNPNKWGRYIDGIKVVGGRDDILKAAKDYHIDKIYVAIPSASRSTVREILNICKETDCELKNLPGMYQLYKGELTVSNMRPVSIEDLLGREPIQVEMDEIFNQIRGKTILVTGGGGSIGSELCRQVAAHNPKTLIIFDVYENNAYDIQLELKRKYPELDLVTLIGSVRDSRKMFDVFSKYRPDIVYHAAAHKHVPLMEDSPCEAVKNNAIGTYKTAYAAMVFGCQRFVLISTDKAVNPTNVMGATKRLCEMIITAFDQKIKEGKAAELPQLFTHSMSDQTALDAEHMDLSKAHTEYVAVRFGNVLGSNGSVIPIFKRQIERGGPVTVTHPDIIRYFMTIPEAVSLVLQAGGLAKGGEIFVLDMGEPVKIDTLARNLIKLSGLKPDVDVKIEYTGLRPGEKLYEEKLMAEEGLKRTSNNLIHIGQPIPFDTEEFLGKLEGIMEAAYKNKEDIRDYLKDIVSTYHEV